MDSMEVRKRYLYLEKILQKLGLLLMSEKVTVVDLEIPHSTQLGIYRRMEKDKFQNSAVDYLCYISMMYFQYCWILSIKSKIKDVVELESKDLRLKFYLNELAELCFRDEGNAKNMLRIFYKRPDLFFKSEMFQDFIRDFKHIKGITFQYFCSRILSVFHLCFHFGHGIEEILPILEMELKGIGKINIHPTSKS